MSALLSPLESTRPLSRSTTGLLQVFCWPARCSAEPCLPSRTTVATPAGTPANAALTSHHATLPVCFALGSQREPGTAGWSLHYPAGILKSDNQLEPLPCVTA